MRQTTERKADNIGIVRRTGNVFAQLGMPDADELYRKSCMLSVIHGVIEERGLDQATAAKALGLDQADVSRLLNNKIKGFSLDRLMTLVFRLGVDIELTQGRDSNGDILLGIRRLDPV
jgi:predicted XRE-type DNA-binding protein